MFYSYKSFPNDSQIWETSLFTINTTYYSINAFAWFFTCKHWWHWIILVPITMYSFQLWGIINQSSNLDEVELIYLLPLMMFLIPFVYVICAKLFDKVRGDDLESFEEELSQKRSTWQQIRDLFR